MVQSRAHRWRAQPAVQLLVLLLLWQGTAAARLLSWQEPELAPALDQPLSVFTVEQADEDAPEYHSEMISVQGATAQ